MSSKEKAKPIFNVGDAVTVKYIEVNREYTGIVNSVEPFLNEYLYEVYIADIKKLWMLAGSYLSLSSLCGESLECNSVLELF